MPTSDRVIAARAVQRGLIEQAQLDACLAERRRLLKDGLELTLRELLLDRGHLDQARWESLDRQPETLAEPQEPSEGAGSEPEGPEGRRLGDYRIVGELGRGAMGIVYEAVQEPLDRTVAIKVLPESQALQGVARERFMREAKATASLKHPGIVPIYDIGEERGIHFFAMELLRGRSLKVVLDEEGPLAPPQAARIIKEAAEALQYAHEHGVIHRDVKPDNIILQDDGAAVLTDFGLARHESDRALTRAGVIVGTPLYMAPEQARGDEVDLRADLYGLGITLYELLAGTPPFNEANETGALLEKVAHQEPAPLRSVAPQVPAELAAIVEVAIEKEPVNRFASAGAMAADLGRFLRGEPIQARPPSRVTRTLRRVRRHGRSMVLAFAGGLIVMALGIALRQLNLRWRADNLVLESISLIKAGQRDEAQARLKEALELWPGLAEAQFRRGELALLAGEREEALTWFERALAGDDQHVEALLARGGLLRQEGKWEAALGDYERARAAASKFDPRPALHGGLVLADLARKEPAITWLREGLELARNARAERDDQYREAVRRLGGLLLETNQPEAALTELEESVRLEPNRVDAKVLLAKALFLSGNTPAAVEAATAALRRAPKHLRARELRGLAYRRLGQYGDAFKDLTAAQELASARLLRGLVRFEAMASAGVLGSGQSGFDLVGARADLTAALGQSDLTARERCLGRVVLAWIALAAPGEDDGRPRRTTAARQLKKAVDRLPNAPLPRIARGLLYLEQGKLDRAAEELEVARTSTGSYGALVGLAAVAEARGDLPRALSFLNEAIALAPRAATAYGYRYRLRLVLGAEGAHDDRRRAMEGGEANAERRILTPNTDPFLLAEELARAGRRSFKLAMTQPLQGLMHLQQASSWFGRALRLDPMSLQASARQASVEYLLARVPEAERAYARARAIDPFLVEADVARGILQRDLIQGAGPAVAEATFRRALADVPADRRDLGGAVRYELARALALQGKLEPAVAYLREALGLTPRRYCVASLLTRLLFQLNMPEKQTAADLATRLFYEGDRDRVRGTLYGSAGSRLRSLNRPREAEHFLTRAIEADHRSGVAWRERSRVRFNVSFERAPAAFLDAFVAAELDPSYTRRFLEIETRLARFAPVLGAIRARVPEVEKQAPELHASSALGAYLDFYAQKYAAAEEGFEKTLRRSRGRSYIALTYRGAARLRQGKHELALADLVRAEKLLSNAPLTQFWRACLEAAMGQGEAALDRLEAEARRGYLFPAQIRKAPELVELCKHPRLRKLLRSKERQ